MSGKYDMIIDMPHHVSKTRARMSQSDRAAQFSPFAALTGYEEAIWETGRITEERRFLDDDMKAILDERIAEAQERRLPIQVTWFREDGRKSGGSYETSESDENFHLEVMDRTLVLSDGQRIKLSDIVDIKIIL